MLTPERVGRVPDLGRWRVTALVVGVIGLVLTALGWWLDPRAFFAAYLTAYLFWSGIALGCLATALLQEVTGGLWGLSVRRIAEAGARTMPLVTVMFLPILFGLVVLYPWTRPEDVAASTKLQQKIVYLNVPFWIGRAVFYFACWNVLVWLLSRWSKQEDDAADPAVTGRLWRFGVGGMIVLGLTAAFAMIDWGMSLEPEWYSTIYPSMVATGSWLAALAFLIVVFLLMAACSELAVLNVPRVRNDLGSMLLAFVMLWAYQAFSQYLLIWSGNIVEEIRWYLPRLAGGWQWVALAFTVFGFGLPFFLLVFRDLKRNPRTLGAIAAIVLVTRLLEDAWLIGPALGVGLIYVLLVLAAMAGLGGIWLSAFLRELPARPLLPVHDPRLANLPEAEHVPA